MITEWTIGNFKSVAGPEKLKLAPLTVLAGANSSGKSTVLQSILLIAQTLRSKRTSRALLLNGDLVRLGTFSDLLHKSQSPGNRQSRVINIGFELTLEGGRFPGNARSTDEPRSFDSRLGRRFSGRTRARYLRPTLAKLDMTSSGRTRAGESDWDDTPDLNRLSLDIELVGSSNDIFLGADDDNDGDLIELTSKLAVTRRRTLQGIPSELIEADILSQEDTKYKPILTRPRIKRLSQYPGRPLNRAFLSEHGRLASTGSRSIGVDLNRFLPSLSIEYFNHEEIRIDQAFNAARRLLRNVRQSPSGETSPRHVEILENLEPQTKKEFARMLRALEIDAHYIPDTGDLAPFFSRQLTLEQRRHFYYELTSLQDEWTAQLLKTVHPSLDVTRSQLPDYLHRAVTLIEQFFTRDIEYLGPLREEPRAIYDLPASGDPTDVGLKGEYTAAVLDVNQNSTIQYWDTIAERVVSGSLKEAVHHWLQYFDMAEGVTTSEAGKQGYTLTIRNSDVSSNLDLTNVGVGVSQVLPIIVMGLVARPNATLIYEQPEIHLHPAIQAKIADFFLGLIHCNKQCIIETHSEYFVNRIRLRIAEDDDNESQLSEDVQVLFAEKEFGHTKYRKVEINEYGVVIDWPSGFFDQAQIESEDLIRAALERKQNSDD